MLCATFLAIVVLGAAGSAVWFVVSYQSLKQKLAASQKDANGCSMEMIAFYNAYLQKKLPLEK